MSMLLATSLDVPVLVALELDLCAGCVVGVSWSTGDREREEREGDGEAGRRGLAGVLTGTLCTFEGVGCVAFDLDGDDRFAVCMITWGLST